MRMSKTTPPNSRKHSSIIEPYTGFPMGRDSGVCRLAAAVFPGAWFCLIDKGWIDFRLFLLYAYCMTVILCLLDRKYWDIKEKPPAAAYALCPPAYFYAMARQRGEKWHDALLAPIPCLLTTGACVYLESVYRPML